MIATDSTLPENFRVTLDNCDREPIHIPGRIQSHGVLVAFSVDGTVTHVSTNAAELLGDEAPALGQAFDTTCFGRDEGMAQALGECFADEGIDVQPVALDVVVVGRPMELVGHRLGGRVIAELELRPDRPRTEDHAFKGHRALMRLRRQRTIEELLAAAVEEVRTLTGFDRVMAYRFREDESGEVVAEAKTASLEPFLGQRYPASDIPAQARRLYVLNTLRNISDVARPTVLVKAAAGETTPLDMSHAVLRGVSPIHIEYLSNMGVGASMSISIVIHGALWGMLACHHMSQHVVPYSVRAACDVLAQVLAANVQGILAREHADRMAAAVTIRARAAERLLHADDGVFAVAPQAPDLCEMFNAQALVLCEQGRFVTWGGIPTPVARQMVSWLGESADVSRKSLLLRQSLAGLPAELAGQMGVWCGFMALRFGEKSDGWLILLRKEQIETIAWAGRPMKEYVHGPLGTRLTPRGSFNVWKETVSGKSAPWSDTDEEIARSLLSELMRASVVRGAELDHARGHLLSMLSDGVEQTQQQEVGGVADAPAVQGRMQRLVGQVLDASRLQSGSGLVLRTELIDLSKWLGVVLDEIAAVQLNTRFIREIPAGVMVKADPLRLRQLVDGLLTNAWQHGVTEEPVIVQLSPAKGVVHLEVSNAGEAPPADVVESMFDPLRPRGAGGRSDGLGLGLYIGRSIARAHGGELTYAYAEPYVMFGLRLPLAEG